MIRDQRIEISYTQNVYLRTPDYLILPATVAEIDGDQSMADCVITVPS